MGASTFRKSVLVVVIDSMEILEPPGPILAMTGCPRNWIGWHMLARPREVLTGALAHAQKIMALKLGNAL